MEPPKPEESICQGNASSPFDLEKTSSVTRKVEFNCGNLYLIIDEVHGHPVRVNFVIGKTGCCQRSLLSSIANLVNMSLEELTPLERISKALIGNRCVGFKEETAGESFVGKLSCSDAIAVALREYVPDDNPLKGDG